MPNSAPGAAASLGTSKYVALTTYRKTGVGVVTAVWAVPLESAGAGAFGFWTSSESGKAKRIRNNPQVVAQPSDARGRPKAGTAPITCDAAFATPAQLDEIRSAVRSKYGFAVQVTKLLNTVGGWFRGRKPYGDIGLVVVPRETAG